MKLIFYRGFRGKLLDWLICLWTLGKYSHVELVFNEDDNFWYAYSSSPREKKVRFKNIPKDYSKWTVVDISRLYLDKDVMLHYAVEQEGKGYDYISIFLTFVLPLNIEDRKKWFCSEICTKLLQVGGLRINIKPHKVHPNKLYYIMQQYL